MTTKGVGGSCDSFMRYLIRSLVSIDPGCQEIGVEYAISVISGQERSNKNLLFSLEKLLTLMREGNTLEESADHLLLMSKYLERLSRVIKINIEPGIE